jgi:DNA-directed RNA polymerase specialized sigma24 family protein
MREIPPAQLAARCQNTRTDASHEPFCLELFRRAIVDSCSLSWHYLHNQYYSLVCYWVSRRTPPDPDTVDDLAQEAFTNFWRFYTPDKLRRATELGKVLSYLKSCTATVVAQARRKESRTVLEAEWDEHLLDTQVSARSAEASAFREMEEGQVWAAVLACCNDERDRLVARQVFLANQKPGDIAERYPELFSDVSEVYRVKRNLIDRLRRDSTLQDMCENEENERLTG